MKLEQALKHPDPESRREAKAIEWEIEHGRCFEIRAIDGPFMMTMHIDAFLMPWWKRVFYKRMRTNIIAWIGDQRRRLVCKVRCLVQDACGLKNPHLKRL